MPALLCTIALLVVAHSSIPLLGTNAQPVCDWVKSDKTNIPGGHHEPSAKYVAQCQQICLTKAYCESVDWDIWNRCWLLNTTAGQVPSSDTTHYDHICEGNCPDGFIYLPLAQSCYRIVYEANTWTSADVRCRELHGGAHLAAVTSRDERDALKSFLRLHFQTNPASAVCEKPHTDIAYLGKMLWTSGQRLHENSCIDSFVWKLSKYEQLPFVFTDWYPFEPNCLLNNELCVHLTSSWNYRWNDLGCSVTTCALCEYQPA